MIYIFLFPPESSFSAIPHTTVSGLSKFNNTTTQHGHQYLLHPSKVVLVRGVSRIRRKYRYARIDIRLLGIPRRRAIIAML